MKSIVFVCSERVIRDSESGLTSIINIIDNITVENYPLNIQRITVVAKLKREQGDDEYVNLLLKGTLEDEVLFNIPIKLDFSRKDISYTKINLGGLLIKTPGTLLFTLHKGEQLIADYEVILKPKEKIEVQTS